MSPAVRPPAVAGVFYTGNAAQLAAEVSRLLGAAPGRAGVQPKALIVPHAGYIYSGAAAAAAYARLAPWRSLIRRVVLLGPTHRVAVRGLAIPSADAFATPLGSVALDRTALAAVAGLSQVVVSDAAHAQEHSLEVQLPFLQTALDDFRLAPFAVGHCRPEAVAEVLDRLWGGAETLIVVSSDLSHFLPYDVARSVDAVTCQRIAALVSDLEPDEACGAYPLNGLLLAARRRGLAAELVELCNSGDTAGDKARVVGYGAFTLAPAGAGHA